MFYNKPWNISNDTHIYIAYINYHRLTYGYKVLKSDTLEIRNSPVVKAITLITKLIYCGKIGCQAGAIGGTALSTALGIDQLRMSHGKEPYFSGILGKIIWG